MVSNAAPQSFSHCAEVNKGREIVVTFEGSKPSVSKR
jgi:hypothetical protein